MPAVTFFTEGAAVWVKDLLERQPGYAKLVETYPNIAFTNELLCLTPVFTGVILTLIDLSKGISKEFGINFGNMITTVAGYLCSKINCLTAERELNEQMIDAGISPNKVLSEGFIPAWETMKTSQINSTQF